MTKLHFCVSLALLTVSTAAAAATPPAARAARTLEAITIRGDVEVPQVLFITARDRLRFTDDTGRRYRPDALGILADLLVPTRLRVVAPPGRPGPESIQSR